MSYLKILYFVWEIETESFPTMHRTYCLGYKSFENHTEQLENFTDFVQSKPCCLFQALICYDHSALGFCNHKKAGGVSLLVITIT